MNVDLQWCPCGKQARENDLYCSDICHFLEQYPGARKNYDNNETINDSSYSFSRITKRKPTTSYSTTTPITTTPFGAIPITPSRLTFRSRQKLYNQCINKVNKNSSDDYFNSKKRSEIIKDQRKMKINTKNISKLTFGLKNMVSHSNINTSNVNLYAKKSQDKPLVVY